VSAVEEALSSQLNQRLFFFFLLFLKGGNVLHELPTRTPPTIQGKHQMKKKKKKKHFQTGMHFSTFPSPPPSFTNKNNAPPPSSGQIANPFYLFRNCQKISKKCQQLSGKQFLFSFSD
jgi:hypothetical protein